MIHATGSHEGDRPDPSAVEGGPDAEAPLDRPAEPGSDPEAAPAPDPQQRDRYQPL